MGYFWPTIFQDTKKYVQGCDSCQRLGQPNRSDEILLQEKIVADPFKKRALDFMGPINLQSHQKSHILVCKEYVTKWVVAKALTRATVQSFLEFFFEYNFIEFEVPREIVIDGGLRFTSHLIKKLTKRYNIKHHITSPYYPQANGEV